LAVQIHNNKKHTGFLFRFPTWSTDNFAMTLQTIARAAFFAFVVRPVLLVAIGLNVRHRERLPRTGPAILAANHNSHFDTLALMALFPLAVLQDVRAVAAADHFGKANLTGWIARNLIGILAIERRRVSRHADPLAGIVGALDEGRILILYPEGSRGDPEERQAFKKGIARLAERRRDVPIIPVFLQGFGKVLPRGALLPVPFYCDVVIGEKLAVAPSRRETMELLEKAVSALADTVPGAGAGAKKSPASPKSASTTS
jgi:1-acyl-sn-glycerol-3-phosphate acyltransferase